jgi:hypothetical protein
MTALSAEQRTKLASAPAGRPKVARAIDATGEPKPTGELPGDSWRRAPRPGARDLGPGGRMTALSAEQRTKLASAPAGRPKLARAIDATGEPRPTGELPAIRGAALLVREREASARVAA